MCFPLSDSLSLAILILFALFMFAFSLSLSDGLIYISCPLSYLQGVTAAKNDGFSLTSGDFPTLGSEKDNSGKNESQGYI